MKKFNGFEKGFIEDAIKRHVEALETEVLAHESDGKRLVFAPGYFTMGGGELLDKVNEMTLKKYQNK